MLTDSKSFCNRDQWSRGTIHNPDPINEPITPLTGFHYLGYPKKIVRRG